MAPTRRPISIWQPAEQDGEPVFLRPEPGPFGDHYADVRVLRPKKAELPLRVAFFGESVAAGYLYAPHITPARVLESQLQTAGGAQNFEVVDLARTNETLGSLAATVQASLQIQPDLLVLWVGNNWNLLETPAVSPYAATRAARKKYGQALEEEGLAGPQRLAAESLREQAGATFDLIALIAHTVGIPVILVLPEVSLADWENRQPPVRLPRDGSARWHQRYRQATDRLARGDFESVLEIARAMRDLDGGTCPSTWRLLAKAWAGLGETAEARRAALAEVDAAAYPTLAFLSAPQATTEAREILREAARRHRFFTVDLRAVLAETSAFPGRRLFLDYCHLTSEGIGLAMAAVAAEVLDLSGMPHRLPAGPPPAVSPEVEATARLGAAVHTAHRLLTVGPKQPLLEHWCEAALDASPGIEPTLLDLVEARCAPGPAVLTAAQQRNQRSAYRLLLQHGWRWDFLDASLLEAIRAVLERRGRPAAREIEDRLLEHLAIREEGTELARAPYLWEPLERFFPEVMPSDDRASPAFLRSPWPETRFCLVCDATRDVVLDLTLRSPGRTGTAPLEVNGERVGSVETRETWTRSTFRLGKERLRRGLNRLAILWPEPSAAGDAPFAPAIERLRAGLPADLHPVFGEVWSLLASPRP